MSNKHIGIITPYFAQKRHIVNCLREFTANHPELFNLSLGSDNSIPREYQIKVNTVDGFQVNPSRIPFDFSGGFIEPSGFIENGVIVSGFEVELVVNVI